jgi:hypothetical protein
VTIDKGQKSRHFCEIKKSPWGTILMPEKEDMSCKTRTYGNPRLMETAEEDKEAEVVAVAVMEVVLCFSMILTDCIYILIFFLACNQNLDPPC